MKRWMQSPWTAAIVGTVAYLATLLAAWRPHALPATAAPARPAGLAGRAWAAPNPEIDLLLEELRKQKESVAAKEKELGELAARLETEKNELTQLTQAVSQIQAEFDQNVTRIREEEGANLKKLAKMYSTMSPDGAAAVFKTLDDALLAKVLVFMRESEQAAVLEALARQGGAEARRVASLTERLRLAVTETKK